MKKKATIYDIAREANVSTATVTRVMAGHPSVRPATRLKVQQVIDAQQDMFDTQPGIGDHDLPRRGRDRHRHRP